MTATITYSSVHTTDLFIDLMDRLLRDHSPLTIDIETTGLDPWETGASIVSISLTDINTEETWVVPLDHPEGAWGHEWVWRLGEVMAACKGHPLVAHNANFDLGWIRRFVPDAVLTLKHDTQTWAHLTNENQSKRLKSLGSPFMGGDWGIDVRDCKGTPWWDLSKYNAQDTVATSRLMWAQYKSASKRVSLHHSNVVLPAQRALIDVTHRGLQMDTPRAREALLRAQVKRDEGGGSLMNLATVWDMDPEEFTKVSWEPTSKWFLAFTEKAVEYGALVVQETTPKGRPSWRGGVLERLAREGYGVAQTMLDYRDGAKKAQFIESWLSKMDDRGRVHGNFNIARARTGRLTSSEPNLQQVDRELKRLWTATAGRRFAEVDYSQIEMRVTAEYIHRLVLPNNPMMQAFIDGRDLHSMAATLVTGGEAEDVTKEDRQKGKAVNFGFIFGMGAAGFVRYAEEGYGVTFTLPEAEAAREGFFQMWDGLADLHEHVVGGAQERGYVENLYGRRRHLPDLFGQDDYARAQAERQAVNSLVQGTAADLMLESLWKVDAAGGATIVGTVHDSLLLEFDTVEQIESVCSRMVHPSVHFATPLEVDASLGSHWSEYTETFTRSSL